MFAVLFFCTTVLLLIAFGALFSGDDGLRSVSSGERRRNLTETTLQGHGPNKVLYLPLQGVIGDVGGLFGEPADNVELLQEALKQARDDAQVKAVLLYVDSPGGGLTASDVLYHDFLAFHKETQRPVVALFGDVAASGGYYVASAAQQIVAHPTTLTGSIGVIMPLIGIEKLLDKIGVESRTIKAGELKDMGAMSRPMNERERAMLQGIADEYHQQFIRVVLAGMKERGVALPAETARQYCDGRVFTADQALKTGFVDHLGYFEDALRITCQRAKLSPADSRVVTYHRKPRLLDILMANTQAPKRQATVTLRVQGVPALEQGRFFYMWMPGVGGVSSSAH
jgi:protease-4